MKKTTPADEKLLDEIRRCNERDERGFPSFLLSADEKRRAAKLVRAGLLTATESIEDGRCRDYWIA